MTTNNNSQNDPQEKFKTIYLDENEMPKQNNNQIAKGEVKKQSKAKKVSEVKLKLDSIDTVDYNSYDIPKSFRVPSNRHKSK